VAGEEDKAAMRRLIEEGWVKGNGDVFDEMIAPDYVGHRAGSPQDIRGPEGTKEFVAVYQIAFPDVSVSIEHQIAEGDMVLTHWRLKGTNTSPMMGAPATGKTIDVTGMDLVRFENGQMKESWGQFDFAGMMHQLGATLDRG
jgi:steroid delta-isomerase-like uncharacterized protein